MRLIVDRHGLGRPFPFEAVCAGRLDRDRFDPDRFIRHTAGEISRLAIHQDFRRRRGEWHNPEVTGEVDDPAGGQRRYPLLPMSLFLAAALAMNLGLTQVLVMREPRLARLLVACGIRFEAIGDVIDFHGQRGPFRITHPSLLEGLPPEGRNLLDALRARLA